MVLGNEVNKKMYLSIEYIHKYLYTKGYKTMRVCYVCGRGGSLGKHHIIRGHGKRKTCKTRDSLIDICYDCHKLIHNTEISDLDINLKLQLQDIYFQKSYHEEKVRMLMGGKLYCNSNKRFIN